MLRIKLPLKFLYTDDTMTAKILTATTEINRDFIGRGDTIPFVYGIPHMITCYSRRVPGGNAHGISVNLKSLKRRRSFSSIIYVRQEVHSYRRSDFTTCNYFSTTFNRFLSVETFQGALADFPSLVIRKHTNKCFQLN